MAWWWWKVESGEGGAAVCVYVYSVMRKRNKEVNEKALRCSALTNSFRKGTTTVAKTNKQHDAKEKAPSTFLLLRGTTQTNVPPLQKFKWATARDFSRVTACRESDLFALSALPKTKSWEKPGSVKHQEVSVRRPKDRLPPFGLGFVLLLSCQSILFIIDICMTSSFLLFC